MRVSRLVLALSFFAPAMALAQPAKRPIVVELFTSQGCSSCPPADALVAELARNQPNLLPLTFHVTYWNNLGWQDPFSLAGATERQRHYVARSVSPQVYTPAMVVDGRWDIVGSDRSAVAATLSRARAEAHTDAPVGVVRADGGLLVTIGAGSGNGTVLLVGYDLQHETHIGRGENGGRTLREANVVRSMTTAGAWTGQATQFQLTVPPGEAFAVLVQAEDGRILGAGQLHPS